MAFVVDASLVAAWLLPDESRAETDAILDRLAEEPAIAPDLLMHEVRNILAMAARRGRIQWDGVTPLLERVARLGIGDVGGGDAALVVALARRHGLTSYDAAYLAVAKSEAAPLATLDRRLRAAADLEGVALLPPSRAWAGEPPGSP